jgi:hypothetical protein
LIHEIISEIEFSFVTSFSQAFIITSQPFNQAFSAGEPIIGEIITNSQGISISTYAQIHSYSQFKLSLKFLFFCGGK